MNVNLLLLFLSKSKSESYLRLSPNSNGGVNHSGILYLKKSPTADEVVIAYTDRDGVDQVDRYTTDTEFAASLTYTDDTYIYVSGVEKLHVGEFSKGDATVNTEILNYKTIVDFQSRAADIVEILSCKQLTDLHFMIGSVGNEGVVSNCVNLRNATVRLFSYGEALAAHFDGKYDNLEQITLINCTISVNASNLPSLNLLGCYYDKPLTSVEAISEILAKTNPGGLIKTNISETLEPIATQYGWTVESAENPFSGK